MNTGKILYGLAGLLLAGAAAVTGTHGLSRQNREIYERALSLQQDVDALGFRDFRLDDYKVRFFDGESDYVIAAGEIRKEKPVFTTFVGTAYEVDGEYQVILPVLENFSQMFDLLDTAAGLSEGGTELETGGYGADEHTATLWHETFHAYQMNNYYDNCLGLLQGAQTDGNLEKVILEGVDSQADMVQYFEQGTALLRRAYLAEEESARNEYLRSYLSLEQSRRSLISGEARAAEDYYEAVEGSARYVEGRIISLLKGTEAMENRYIGRYSYEKGAAKYYQTGMLKCLILTQADPGWNQDYRFDRSLNELLQEICG